MVACAMFGYVAVAAPNVKIDKIEDTSVWSTKKVTYTISDVPDKVGVKYILSFDVTAYGVTKRVAKGQAQNGIFTETLDTAVIFGETRKDPTAKIRVSLEKAGLNPPTAAVQLWDGGPIFAACNVGATTPEEPGYYFWWGDTVGYKRNENNTGWVSAQDGMTSIVFDNQSPANSTYNCHVTSLKQNGWIDADGNLTAAHDAATAHWGAPWRMMTKEELDKLVDTSYCTRTWVTSYNGKGVNGYVVKGAKDHYKNNEVFFPAAGWGCETSLHDYGSVGGYWSSAPDSGNSATAWRIFFNSSKFYANAGNGRYCGCFVRAVREFAE